MKKHIIQDNFGIYDELIKSTIRKTNTIKYIAQKTKPWESKLGGCPYLKDINDYPKDNKGNPMMFLAQINLKDIKGLDNLPQKGLLQFYVLNDDCYGLGGDIDGECKVIYIEDYQKDVSNLVLENPYIDSEYTDNLPFVRECIMQFELEEMPINSCNYNWDEVIQYKIQNKELLSEISNKLCICGSRMEGYPYFTQYDPRIDDTYDRLLLQLDVDNIPDLMFGDSGVCNFFINEEDLKNKDFSKVFFSWDCC